jgi:hypothetical protein
MSAALQVVAVLLALVFGALGTAKILGLRPMRERAAEVGFATAAYRRIGVLEVAGAIGLLIGLIEPLIGVLAGAGLLVLLGGALVTHIRNGHGAAKVAPALVCGVLVVVYLGLLGAAAW